MNTMTDDVLVKYLLGEATEAEQHTVQQWINKNEGNKKYFEHFRLIWDESKQLASKSSVNEHEAWERFMQRAQREDATATKARVVPLRSYTWMRVAAMLLLLAGAGWLAYMIAGGGNEQILASSGNEVLVRTLPDGSVITLNKNSTLSYPSKFEGNTRMVTLKGEGFFSITPNKQKPFIIETNNSSVTVVGTTFNVKSTTEKTEVIVETGIVQVAKKQHAIRVLPHQKAIVTKDNDTPQMQENTDELYNYYRTKEFVCHGTPLWRLVSVLNEAYDARIVIENNKLSNLPLETTFHNESLDNILKVISETFNITVEHRGKEIILK